MEGRLDAYYYLPFFKKELQRLYKAKYPIKHLKELCNKITDGTHFTPKYVDKGVPFISVKDIKNSQVLFSDTKYITEEEHKILIKRCNPEAFDILLTKVGTIGNSVVIKEEYPSFSIFVSVALLKINRELVNPFYLSICLNSFFSKLQFQRALKGIGVPDLHLESINEVKIPLPPLAVQQQIVAKMEAAQQSKAQKEAQAQELLNSIDAYVLEQLGITLPEKKEEKKCFVVKVGEVKESGRLDAYYNQPSFDDLIKCLNKGKYSLTQLKKITSKIKTGTTPHHTLNPYIDEGIIFLRNTNLVKYNLDLEEVKYVKNDLKNELTFSNINDLIICIAGTIGVCAVNNSDKEISINQNVSSLTLIKDIAPNYVACFLNCNLINKLFLRVASLATIYYINNENLLSIPIPLPPLAIQQGIAAEVQSRIRQADKLKAEAKAEYEQAKQEIEKMIIS